MTEIRETPYIEAVVNAVLAEAEISAFSELPKEPAYPLIVTERLGGVSPVPEAIDDARVQLTSWGASKSSAWSTVVAARKAIYSVQGTRVSWPSDDDPTALCFIAGVRDESVGLWLPDQRTGKPRYLTTLRITSREVVLSAP